MTNHPKFTESHDSAAYEGARESRCTQCGQPELSGQHSSRESNGHAFQPPLKCRDCSGGAHLACVADECRCECKLGGNMTSPQGVVLKQSEWGRPIVYIAESSWYGGVTTNQCVFSSREEAVRWAKGQGREFLDWDTWAPRGKYPDCEFDSEQFDPTFLAKWDDGFVKVTKTEVNTKQ